MSVYNHIDHFLQRLVGKNKCVQRLIKKSRLQGSSFKKEKKHSNGRCTICIPYTIYISFLELLQQTPQTM